MPSYGRKFDDDFLDALRQVNPEPIILFEITTGLTSTGNDIIRVALYEKDVVWPSVSGNTFTARAGESDDFKMQYGENGEFNLTLGDGDGYFETWLLSTDFRYQKVTRYLIEVTENDDSDKAMVDSWRIDHIEQQPHQVTFVCEPLVAVLARIKVPKRVLTREDYPGMVNEGVVRL